MIPGITDAARLLRGFATDFLTSHDVSQVPAIMHPDYSLSIGGHLFEGRDNDYLPATRAQLEQFPGLVVTVHDTLLCEGAVALRFTEHGASMRNQGRAAAWGGISLFEIKNGRLRRGWAEEDYFARKQQLSTGEVNPVEAPAAAPWDGVCHPNDENTAAIVRQWIAGPQFLADPVVTDIGVGDPAFRTIIDVSSIATHILIAGGGRAAFHLSLDGIYAGGFETVPADQTGVPLTLPVAGMVSVADGAVTEAHLCADRLSALRSLSPRKG